MKKYRCVQTEFPDVGARIEEFQKEGWRLHSWAVDYKTHFLLLEKGEDD